MRESIVLNTIVDTVPQWYICDHGKQEYTLSFENSSVTFCSHRPLTDKLRSLLVFSEEQKHLWLRQLPKIPTPSAIAKVSEDMVLRWLDLCDPSVNWNKWIAYAEGLRQKTHENFRVERNLIISPSASGSHDITDPTIQHVLDSLTAHPQVYMRVDKDLGFVDYDEIQWGEVKDSQGYKFSPEFLQPLASMARADEYYAHLSSRGDILIAGKMGLLAACRKGKWFVYDVESLRDCIVEIIGDYNVGCHLFEVLFDLSYRRHGALLVFDPERKVVNRVANKNSLIMATGDTYTSDIGRQLLAPRIRSINMGEVSHKERKKRLFLEVAEVDGALIFDTEQVLAFGAMIEFHPNSGHFFGARSAAAQSALLWGGHAFKISADGDITVLFTDRRNAQRNELRFM